ncbi:MAG TPA: DUF4388 domain-containing protein [Thermomicrobiales bacterium]|nr:DUF4388 domain-containing protein [Thermomicrobiales bacterium]
MSTIGELTDFGVPDLIDVLARRERTGRLTVKAGGQEVFLYFDRGRLVLVTSSGLTLRLGRMLVRQGLLDTPRLLEVLHAQAEGGNQKPIGALLVERGWITETDLARCVEDQAIEVVARAINDEAGLFIFDPDVVPASLVDGVPLEPGALLRAAFERTEALRMLRKQLPEPSTPYALVEPIGTGKIEHLASPEAMVVNALRTGAKTLPELSVHMALDELTLGVAVLSLTERGLITTTAGNVPGRGRTAIR